MSENDASNQSAARRAVNKVKSAPQKIVEHALNTAINTVERAVETDVKRTAKKVAKSTKKLEKAQRLARQAKSEAKRAHIISSELTQMQKNETKNKVTDLKGAIKDKFKDIISPQKEVTFYYDRRQLLVLTALYVIIAMFVYLVSICLQSVEMLNSWILFGFLVATQLLTLGALASAFFVLIVPLPLAHINKEGIKIDHNERLDWHDIELAEEKYTSHIMYRPFIALHVSPKNLEKYRLTFMQKLCRCNIFTPFSIPLYAMRPEDSSAIREIIKKHAPYKDSRDTLD